MQWKKVFERLRADGDGEKDDQQVFGDYKTIAGLYEFRFPLVKINRYIHCIRQTPSLFMPYKSPVFLHDNNVVKVDMEQVLSCYSFVSVTFRNNELVVARIYVDIDNAINDLHPGRWTDTLPVVYFGPKFIRAPRSLPLPNNAHEIIERYLANRFGKN